MAGSDIKFLRVDISLRVTSLEVHRPGVPSQSSVAAGEFALLVAVVGFFFFSSSDTSSTSNL